MPFCLFVRCLPPTLPACPAAGAVGTEGIVLAPSAWEWVVSAAASALGAQAELLAEGGGRGQEWEMDAALGMR